MKVQVGIAKTVATLATVPLASMARPIPRQQAAELAADIQPGDILLSSNKDVPLFNGLLGLLGSRYAHVALCVGGERLVGSAPQGVVGSRLFESGSHFALVRPDYPTPEARQRAVDYALRAEKERVAYHWLGESQSLEQGVNCTQLVAEAVAEGLENFQPERRQVLGHRYIGADAFLHHPQMETRFDHPLSSGQNLLGAVPVVGATLAGGVGGAWLARHLSPEPTLACLGAGLGAGLGYALATLGVLVEEVRFQAPLGPPDPDVLEGAKSAPLGPPDLML